MTRDNVLGAHRLGRNKSVKSGGEVDS
jgi:hypothetical protein